VFRSLKHLYCQVIDDEVGKTLVSSSTLQIAKAGEALSKSGNRDAATRVGKDIAEKAKAAGVTAVVFDRGPYKFHGRVKALAEAAREGGLQF
jgi:large subunit ribosomal protein L18